MLLSTISFEIQTSLCTWYCFRWEGGWGWKDCTWLRNKIRVSMKGYQLLACAWLVTFFFFLPWVAFLPYILPNSATCQKFRRHTFESMLGIVCHCRYSNTLPTWSLFVMTKHVQTALFCFQHKHSARKDWIFLCWCRYFPAGAQKLKSTICELWFSKWYKRRENKSFCLLWNKCTEVNLLSEGGFFCNLETN